MMAAFRLDAGAGKYKSRLGLRLGYPKSILSDGAVLHCGHAQSSADHVEHYGGCDDRQGKNHG